jgi:hypothetical protein
MTSALLKSLQTVTLLVITSHQAMLLNTSYYPVTIRLAICDQDRHVASTLAGHLDTPLVQSRAIQARELAPLGCISRAASFCVQMFTLVSAALQSRSYSNSYGSTISPVVRNSISIRTIIQSNRARTVINSASLKRRVCTLSTDELRGWMHI